MTGDRKPPYRRVGKKLLPVYGHATIEQVRWEHSVTVIIKMRTAYVVPAAFFEGPRPIRRKPYERRFSSSEVSFPGTLVFLDAFVPCCSRACASGLPTINPGFEPSGLRSGFWSLDFLSITFVSVLDRVITLPE